LMTTKIPPEVCREYAGASSSNAVTLERSLDIFPASAIVAAPGAGCKQPPGLVSSHGNVGARQRDDDARDRRRDEDERDDDPRRGRRTAPRRRCREPRTRLHRVVERG